MTTFWDTFGKTVCVAAVLFVFVCAVGFLVVCADAYQSYQHDATPLLAPETAPTKPKVVEP